MIIDCCTYNRIVLKSAARIVPPDLASIFQCSPLSNPRQRSLRPPLQGQISDRITRIADIDRLPRLIIIRQLPQIDHDLIIRRAAILYADVVHGGVDVVHAGLVRRSGRAAVVLGQPEAHDAAGARVGPLPLAGRGFGRVEEGAGVEGDGEAVVPGDVEAGAVVEEEGAVGGGAGDEGDGAGAGVGGGEGVLDEGAAGVEGVGWREEGGEEEEDEESGGGRIPHGAGFGCICSMAIRGWRSRLPRIDTWRCRGVEKWRRASGRRRNKREGGTDTTKT